MQILYLCSHSTSPSHNWQLWEVPAIRNRFPIQRRHLSGVTPAHAGKLNNCTSGCHPKSSFGHTMAAVVVVTVSRNILTARMLGRSNNFTLWMRVGLILLRTGPNYSYTNPLREEARREIA